MTDLLLEEARAVASAYLQQRGYEVEARMILAGRGDDWAEVRLALDLRRLARKREERLMQALDSYADPDFWDGVGSGLSLAEEDCGDMARQALDPRHARSPGRMIA